MQSYFSAPSSLAAVLAIGTNANNLGITNLASLGFQDTNNAGTFNVTQLSTSTTQISAARTVTWDVNNASHTLKFTAASTVTFPAGTNTLAVLGANTFTALQTITQASANAGILASTGYSLTGSDTTSMVNLAGTTNTSGVVDVFKIAITNTGAGVGSMLMRLVAGAGGVSTMFSVSITGAVTATGTIQGANLDVAAAGYLEWIGRCVMRSPADSQIVLTNGAENGFSLLNLGPATSGFSAFKVSTTTILCRLGNDGGYATFDAGAFKVGGVAGVDFGPAAPASITVVKGIITAAS